MWIRNWPLRTDAGGRDAALPRCPQCGTRSVEWLWVVLQAGCQRQAANTKVTHTQTHPGAQLLCLGGQGQEEDEKDPRWVCERGLWCWVESRATEVRGQPKFSQCAAWSSVGRRGVRAGEEQNCNLAAGGQGSPAQVSLRCGGNTLILGSYQSEE